MVTLEGTIVVGDNLTGGTTAGTEVHHLAITSADAAAVVLSDTLDAVLEGLWVHDAADGGLLLVDS